MPCKLNCVRENWYISIDHIFILFLLIIFLLKISAPNSSPEQTPSSSEPTPSPQGKIFSRIFVMHRYIVHTFFFHVLFPRPRTKWKMFGWLNIKFEKLTVASSRIVKCRSVWNCIKSFFMLVFKKCKMSKSMELYKILFYVGLHLCSHIVASCT